MATGDYATLDVVKARIGATTSAQDAMLGALITAASRAVDDYCQRSFYQSASQTRYFSPEEDEQLVEVDDLLTVTSLTTDGDGDGTYETTWATTDYVLTPWNAVQQTRPYTQIRRNESVGRYVFPYLPRSVKITGTWGYWTSTPTPVVEATIRMTERLYKLKDAPLGVVQGLDAAAGGTSLMRVREDYDVMQLLNPYVKRWAVL